MDWITEIEDNVYKVENKRGLIVRNNIEYRGEECPIFEYSIPKWNEENFKRFDGIIFKVETILDKSRKIYKKRYIAEDSLVKPQFKLTYDYEEAIKFDTLEEFSEDVYKRVNRMYKEGRIK